MNISLLIRSVVQSYISKSRKEITHNNTTTVTIENKSNNANSEYTLQDVKGVGPTYEEKLNDININSVYELSQTSSDTLSDKLGISIEHANKWIDSSEKLIN